MNGQKPLLVVVDDEQGILDVVSRFAQRAGYDALACSNGRDAIAQLQTRRADLVMVDLRMPDLGGLDVLRAIRDIDPRCQAVLMTGYRLGRHRGRGDQARRDRLPEQAARLRPARAAARRRARRSRAAPQPALDRERRGAAAGVLRHDRPRPG